MIGRRLRSVLRIFFGAALAALGADGAFAQEDEPRNVPVTQRERPEIDPPGIRAGGFLLRPSVAVSTVYDDNVYGGPDAEADAAAVADVQVSGEADLTRHAFGFRAGGQVARYLAEQELDYLDAFAEARGRVDVRRDLTVGLGAEAALVTADPTLPEFTGVREARQFVRTGGTARVGKTFNRVTLSTFGEAARFDFLDDIDSGLNRTEYGGGLRASYARSPEVSLFAQAGAERRVFDASGSGAADRDQTLLEAGGGVSLDFTGVLFGSVFAGWGRTEFDDPGRDGTDELALRAGLTWNATRLTTVNFTASSGTEATTTSGASAIARYAAALSVDHELKRNLLIGGTVGYAHDDFIGASRTDDRIRAGLRATYFLNRYTGVQVSYDFLQSQSNASVGEFDRNRIAISIVFGEERRPAQLRR